ncbi:HAMP domain-containing sensor histidine kinase [Olsenella sp. An290]|uniref:sensor histidine kinase n=1 Tax=Olsenella sp. An290 TaxID=1965625 RepID=UPI00117D645D|nr:HAMP domain-containing sensor histidine kinase [Olsenella sp. An290]
MRDRPLAPSARRDLAALSELLDRAAVAPAARARLTSADPAVAGLARAIDRHLDADLERDLARRRADERFREQLAALSHDIRTPLAGAQGYLQLARRTTDPGRVARYLDGVEERLAAMRALTDDLFAYARAADPSWRPELKPCDLALVVADALAARYEAFGERGWEPDVRLDRTSPALAAPDALARVIDNLLENALAHGSGAPLVHVAGTALTVRNPVAPADAARLDPARLTERFYQGDASRASGGTGLGLAVARALAEAMGGSLLVGVSDGDAPLFSARLELRPAGAPAPAPASLGEAPAAAYST